MAVIVDTVDIQAEDETGWYLVDTDHMHGKRICTYTSQMQPGSWVLAAVTLPYCSSKHDCYLA